MKILIVGAGAIGGYFGGRLVEKGEDVTFLVRKKRRDKLEETGLVIKSINGDFSFRPKMISSGEEAGPFDAVLIATKAYHLDAVMDDIKPYIGENTMVVPLLNGMFHMDKLIGEFGRDRVIGGMCFIETTLDAEGRILQKSPAHDLVFGERNGKATARIKTLEAAFSGTKANFRRSGDILKDMWEKYLFIATFSGITSLMRTPIGPIRDVPEGEKAVKAVIGELIAVMQAMEAPIEDELHSAVYGKIASMADEMKSSMQRDMEKGLPTEGDHFYRPLLLFAEDKEIGTPKLELIHANLKVYEGGREQK